MQGSKPTITRIAWLFALVLATTAVVVATAVWWRSRPFAEVESYLEAGDAELALETANALLTDDPQDRRALSLKARALVELSRWYEASLIFSQIDVRSPEERRAWATALVHLHHWRRALPLLEQLLERAPDDPLALQQITTCRFQLGQIEAALESAARLAQIPGHEVDGLFLSGVIHRSQANLHRAIESWVRIEELRPDGRGLPIQPAEFFLIYGEDLVSEGTARLALTQLRKSQELEETLAVLLRLGQVHAMLGHEAEAVEFWTRALKHDADNQEARHGLAELALARSDAKTAVQWLAPIASGPDVSSPTAYLMQRAHTLLGNRDKLEHWQRLTAELREAEKRAAALQRSLNRGL